ncbi:MAG TPA: accessory gene regulator B family protein [Pseudobacteroides sp.]|uniref:accessory gene regulator ArgB-like protein n=1 Tax=Pseudobacteroides sp. TaxID=1968840 RepID=UPI002F9238ED
MIEYLCVKIVDFLKGSMDGIDSDKEETLKYGLDILIYNALLLAFFFMLAALLGVIKPVVVSLSVYGSLRIAAGGAHAKTRTSCFVISNLTFFGAVFMAKYLVITSFIPAIIIFFINILAMVAYAPGDTFEKPIISKRIKYCRKLASGAVAVAVLAISFKVYDLDMVLYSVILFSNIPFILLLTPLGYKLLGCLHSNGEIEEC